MNDSDHVVMDTNNGVFECKHCGERQQTGYPSSIDEQVQSFVNFMAQMQSFVKVHQACEERKV